jgi:diadenosine tetraphosphate (Ap4A) HIT family hydrolase
MGNCVFCDIISHEIFSYVVDENDEVIAILPKDIECF